MTLRDAAQLNGPGTTGLSYRTDMNSNVKLCFSSLRLCVHHDSLLSNCTLLSVHAAGRRDTRVNFPNRYKSTVIIVLCTCMYILRTEATNRAVRTAGQASVASFAFCRHNHQHNLRNTSFKSHRWS